MHIIPWKRDGAEVVTIGMDVEGNEEEVGSTFPSPAIDGKSWRMLPSSACGRVRRGGKARMVRELLVSVCTETIPWFEGFTAAHKRTCGRTSLRSPVCSPSRIRPSALRRAQLHDGIGVMSGPKLQRKDMPAAVDLASHSISPGFDVGNRS